MASPTAVRVPGGWEARHILLISAHCFRIVLPEPYSSRGPESPTTEDRGLIGLVVDDSRVLGHTLLDLAANEEIERLVKNFLPFLDGLEHVLKMARMHPPSQEVTNWLKTIESLYFRITNILEKHELQAIDSVGCPVNLDYHEVVEYIPSKESTHNTIIAERQKGYIFKGKVYK